MRAEVVVIGGGVIGASVAWHLAKAGVRDVLIVDGAHQAGQGSTGRATGGYRAQFPTAINVRLSLRSRDRLISFREETAVDPGYMPVGYLWLASSREHLSQLREAQLVQHAEGLSEAMEIGTDDIRALNPLVSTEGIVGAVFCPTDGYIRPLELLRGFSEAGARLGVRTEWNSECTGFRMRGNRITHVKTPRGEIEAGTVVNAAGAWAAPVAAMAGVDLPVTPLRRQAAVTNPAPRIPADMPLTIFTDTGFHLRARDGRAVICWPVNDGSVSLEADDDWVESVTGMMHERLPALADVTVDRSLCYGGLYEMSPDHHAIVGFAAECGNLFLVNGSSGHGVMHSPVLGEIAAAMIAGDQPPIDVHVLRPSRFAEGDPVRSAEML